MTDRLRAIENFLDACSALADGKYSGSEGKISAILAAIAQSPDLTELFTAVTQDFDYVSVKRHFFRKPVSGTRAPAYLPAERSDLLAFVFCLFAEIDNGTLPFSGMLLDYFYVDGSYTASFNLFCERVVRPFRDIVADCFPALRTVKRGEDDFSKLAMVLPLERTRILALSLRDTDRQAFESLFLGLSAAVENRDGAAVKAILAGYRYFLRFLGAENELSAQIFEIASLL